MDFLYFDCFSGVSGDMLIAALLDLGVDFENFIEEIARLNLSLSLSCEKVNVSGIISSRFLIDQANCTTHRHLPDICRIIESSTLKGEIKQKSLAVFNKLAAAEAQVHGVPLENIHFHEIGAVDTIVDIVGTFICLDLLNISQIYASPLPWSQGFIDIEHGRYPLPAPAVVLLLKGVPCCSAPIAMELVTPTGAALITSLTSSFGPIPNSTPLEIGYGAGTTKREDRVPNLLRVVKASLSPALKPGQELVAVLEAEVDDLNPELLGYLFETLLSDDDVLDLYTSTVMMKKNRPGFLLTVMARPAAIDKVAGILFRESTTLGIRHRLQARTILPRHYENVHTPWGPVRVKVAHLPEGEVRAKPEFEDCRAIAASHNLPLPKVYAMVNELLSQRHPSIED
ncbi:MAG: nickel pincer cofactor biosynthesis protein LarC [Syntrophomonas sp.]